jgi:hypothetical protein
VPYRLSRKLGLYEPASRPPPCDLPAMISRPPVRHQRVALRGMRRGLSLLEVVAASSIMAVALVPALRIMRDALTQSRTNETRCLLTTLCISTMEQYLPVSADGWATSTVTGNFAADGYSTIKFQVVRSDAPASGGLTNQLMAVTTTVWEDTNGDGAVSTGELSVVMASKVAKMALYQALP